MTSIYTLLALFFVPPMALAVLFPVAVQYDRGGWWRIVAPITIVALLFDVFANYTSLAVLTWDWPRQHEATFSLRLKRLKLNLDWRGAIAWPIAAALNWVMPGHV